MVGANPKSEAYVRVTPAKKPGSSRHARLRAATPSCHWLPLLSILVPLSLTLAQCGKAPSAGSLAANVQDSSDTFDDRFPQPQFKDRFPTAAESLQQRPANVAVEQTQPTVLTLPDRVAALAPNAPYQRA